MNSEHLVSIIPVSGEWEHLFPVTEDDGTHREAFSEPVIAWGLTADGVTIPVTATKPCGTDDGALRKVGDARVWTPEIDFSSVEHWLASIDRRAPQEVAEGAK
jgi:hypothetical protein